MRHISGDTLDNAEIFHLKNSIRAASLKYFTNIIPEFMNSKHISAVHGQQCKAFLEGQKFTSKIDRKILDAGLKIWRLPSFQDYLQELLVSEDFLDESLIRIRIDSFEQCHTNDRGQSTSLRKIHSDNPAKRFLNCFDKIVSEGYIPNLEDTLSLRIPTTGNVSHLWFI